MNAAVEYIEENLSGEIDMSIAASKACCSEYHFTRMFSYIADLPLNEYIRNRRLTLAGFMLQRSNLKVIEIANMFGYTSPNSFTRAFYAMHGVLPSNARDVSVKLQLIPRITFTIDSKTAPALTCQIVKENEKHCFGISFTTKSKEAYETVPMFWDKCEEERITNKIVEAGHGDEKTLLNSVMWDIDDEMMKYMICLDMPKGRVSDEFETVTVPARTWAVFPLVMESPEDSVISVWKRIYPEWFPTSGYELDSGPRQERCYWRDDGKMLVEAWIPVVKQGENENRILL